VISRVDKEFVRSSRNFKTKEGYDFTSLRKMNGSNNPNFDLVGTQIRFEMAHEAAQTFAFKLFIFKSQDI
jgi:hypothetical protein